MSKLTKEQLRWAKIWHDEGMDYADTARKVNATFGLKKSRSAIRHALKPKKKRAVATIFGESLATTLMRQGEDNSSVLVISDMHAPYQHPDTIAFLGALKEQYRPSRVVCIGDEVDHHAMSFHDSDPDLFSAGDELLAAIEQLRPLYTMFPVMDLVDSNHGSMVYRKGKHGGIPRKYLREYGEVLDAPKTWRWHHELTIDLPGGNKCLFHHGIASDVMKVVALRGTCVVQGHYHCSFRVGYIGNPAALLWGMNVGCLIDSKSLAFAYDNTNLGRPVIGCGIIINGQAKLLPMVLGKDRRWNGVLP